MEPWPKLWCILTPSLPPQFFFKPNMNLIKPLGLITWT